MAGKITTEPTAIESSPLLERMLASAARQGKTSNRLWNEFQIVGIDPGETTGFAVYQPWVGANAPQTLTFQLQQLKTQEVEEGWDTLEVAWPETRWPTVVICEDYKVYSWKSDSHKWAGLHTPQFIGAIRIFCKMRRLPLFFAMAGEAKSWATDENLRQWGVYEPGLKHGRDALRHILRFMFFGGSQPTVQEFLGRAKMPT